MVIFATDLVNTSKIVISMLTILVTRLLRIKPG
jgi:hypothetical protein